ncbi:MAG: hypothetical protein Q9167_001675 [Letrouitia subvulpina]
MYSPRVALKTDEKGELKATIRIHEGVKEGQIRYIIVPADDAPVLHQKHLTRLFLRNLRSPTTKKVPIEDLFNCFGTSSAKATEIEVQALRANALMPHPPPKSPGPVLSRPFRSPGVPRPPHYDAAIKKCHDERIPLSAPPAVAFTNTLREQTYRFYNNEDIAWAEHQLRLQRTASRLSSCLDPEEKATIRRFKLAPAPSAAEVRRMRREKRREEGLERMVETMDVKLSRDQTVNLNEERKRAVKRGERRWRWRVEKKVRRASF